MASEWEQAVRKLRDSTVNGKTEWRGVDLNLDLLERRNRELLKGTGYTTTVNDREILVYEFRYKHYHDEENWNWGHEVAIEFADDDSSLEYEWPQVPGRWQLLAAIQLKVSKAESFLEEFLPYHVGEKPGEGVYECIECGLRVTVGEGSLPPCQSCPKGQNAKYSIAPTDW